MKCTDDEYRCRYEDTKDTNIYDLINRDKKCFSDESKMFSSLERLFTSLLKLAEHNDEEYSEYIKISDSIDIIVSFLKNNYKDMYYRFMGVLSNKQIHFISYDDLPEMISNLFDYIYNIVNGTDLTSGEVLKQVSDILYDHLFDSDIFTFLLYCQLDLEEIIMNCIFVDDYECYKKDFIDSFVKKENISSFATDKEIFVCYDNTIMDVFSILHEFIYLDNLCPDNVIHYDENIYFGDFTSNRPHNFFLNEIPSIMMEGELFDYLSKHYDYDLSFYLSYRIKRIENEVIGFYLPLMNDVRELDNGYIDIVRYSLNRSEKFRLMYMFMYEHDNYDNRHLSYILGVIISMYAMTLSKEERNSIFNYVRSKITSDEDYFTMFKNIGLDILDSNDMDKLICSLYERNRVMKNSLVKKR